MQHLGLQSADMPSHEMAMMGVTAYRQLLRTSKMRTAGAPAPEESAVALQHVSKQSK